jgi:hypothetical protein
MHPLEKDYDSNFLYHYFEKERGPFLSLSNLSDNEAHKIGEDLKEENNIFTKRNPDGQYMFYRRLIEDRIYSLFIENGGKPARKTPHYFIIGECHRCKSWYKGGDYIKIPIEKFDMNTVSFTYSDSFPTFDPSHGDKSEYRQRIYTYNEILEIIKKFGFPQNVPWTDDTPYWQPGYVEAQVWNNIPVDEYENIYKNIVTIIT